ncbi:hypothetical protein CROQUDRAFT_655779 [Cronartium quercuum f. sp. fusiforme G11]|uniref:Uncharacterized protein n=1 Tax=Cronartium quercuum f. sp. fusiforme G11 TaxID=708437 RepID=A0A9P6NPD5_9BASI|nr:hypothetical protein CROQUDRAFT_655779 [Cronartium quercuum f. sp. fusiforme G11]
MVSTTEQPVAAAAPAPIIKDVDQLKANLKEEKRARAEATAPETTATPAKATEGTLDPDASDAPDSERRKRRKMGENDDEDEILDGPLYVSNTEKTKLQEKVDQIIEPAKPVQKPTDNQPSKPEASDEAEKSKAAETTQLSKSTESIEAVGKTEPTILDEPAPLTEKATPAPSTENETGLESKDSSSTPVAAPEPGVA